MRHRLQKEYNIIVGKERPPANHRPTRGLNLIQVYRKLLSKNFQKDHSPDIYKFSYWLWYIIPFVSLIISVIAYRNYLKSHADMAAFNSRRANKLARRRLRKAAAAMKSDNSRNLYDELLIALWGYLGDKLKMPTSGTYERQHQDSAGNRGYTRRQYFRAA